MEAVVVSESLVWGVYQTYRVANPRYKSQNELYVTAHIERRRRHYCWRER